MKKLKIAVYGGSFNPPHPGHQGVVSRLLEQADQVIVVPSFAHPFQKPMLDFETRLNWVRVMTKDFPQDRVMVSDVERSIAQYQSPVYSIDLLERIQADSGLPASSIGLVIGQDLEKAVSTFYGYDRIIAKFQFLVLEEILPLHSSMIREALNASGSIPSEWMLEGLELSDYLPILTMNKVA